MNDNSNRTNINWYPGHMVKPKKQIEEDLKLIDVVIEILDARIPRASQNPDIQELIKNKKKIIALNKSDLADDIETKKWISYFFAKHIKAIAINANTGNGIEEIIKQIKNIMQEELLKQAAKGRTGKAIRVLILGIPNVGKSSFINRIAKKTSAEVGNKPGVTKKKQWIRVNNEIELLDTPGVLWPKFESEEIALNLAYTGTIKDDILDKEEVSYFLAKYLYNHHISRLIERYKLDEEIIKRFENIEELLNEIGKIRGALLPGGRVSLTKVADILLEDFRTGKLGKITLEVVN